MLAFPIAVLLYLSLYGIWDKSKIAIETRSLQSLSALAVKASALIHEIQKERAVSSIFIGSKGVKFAPELSTHRSDTDKGIAELNTFFKGFDSNQFGPEFKNTLDAALNNLDKIKGKRDSINMLNISAEESIAYYTNTIASFLSIITHISRLSTHGELSTLQSGYVNFLWEKEWAGRERAILSSAFSADRFEPGMLNKFISIVAVQDTYTNVFLSFATSDQKDLYNDKMRGQFIDEVARMRKIVFERADDKSLGVDPEHWFNMITGKIDILKDVEDKLSNDLNLKAEQLKNNTQSAMISFMVVTIVVVLVTIFLTYIVIRSILYSLNELVKSSQKITAGDLITDVEVMSKDEIGTLANAFCEMAANLRETLKKTKELSVNVNIAVKTIGGSASSISRGSEDQATAMAGVSFSVEGVHKMATDVTNGMEQLSRLSEDASSSILEMAASINEVDGNMDSLTAAVYDISASIEEIAKSLKEVASGVNYISKGAEKTVASLIQIDTSAAEIEGHTKEVAELSDEVAKEGEKGVKAVELTHAGMKKINEEVKQLAMIINELEQRSEEIGKIVNVINDVTDETTLLALNAAILAAQAGEHGRGFSVVAEEIRELSNRTNSSTKEITGIVSSIQGQIKKALTSVEASTAKVVEGDQLSTETIGVFRMMLERFKTFQDKSTKIAKAAEEQTKGCKQVTQGLEAVTSTIHQMARSTEEQSQGSTQIVQSVERTKESVSQIRKAVTEQANNSKVIASYTENIMSLIQEINTLSYNQKTETQKISAAVIETATIAGAGMGSAAQLEEAVVMLKKEVESLNQGMDKFNLE